MKLIAAVTLMMALQVGSLTVKAASNETNIRCRGTSPSEDMYFKYDIWGDPAGNYRTRLQVAIGYNNNKDFGWKNIPLTNNKLLVDSPWPQYQAVIRRTGAYFELILSDLQTGAQMDQVPYDNFTCVIRL